MIKNHHDDNRRVWNACINLMRKMDAALKNDAENEDDFIGGIVKGLKDFADGRFTVFEDDEEMEAHLMRL